MTCNPERIAQAAAAFGERKPRRQMLDDDSCLDRPVSATAAKILEARKAKVREWIRWGKLNRMPVSDAYCTGHGNLSIEQVQKIREELK